MPNRASISNKSASKTARHPPCRTHSAHARSARRLCSHHRHQRHAHYRHSAVASSHHRSVARGFLPRGLSNTCPQSGAMRSALAVRGQVSNKPKQFRSLNPRANRAASDRSLGTADVACDSFRTTNSPMRSFNAIGALAGGEGRSNGCCARVRAGAPDPIQKSGCRNSALQSGRSRTPTPGRGAPYSESVRRMRATHRCTSIAVLGIYLRLKEGHDFQSWPLHIFWERLETKEERAILQFGSFRTAIHGGTRWTSLIGDQR